MTFGDLQTEVFRRIEESQSDPDYWELPEVKTAIQEGWEELARATHWYRTSVLLQLQDNTTYYALLDHCPDEPLKIEAVWNPETERWLKETSPANLDVDNYRWEAVDGEAERWFLRGAFQLGVWPRYQEGATAHNTRALEVIFRAIPPPLGPDDYSLPFSEEFQEAVLQYAMHDLKSQEGEGDQAIAHWNSFVEIAASMNKWARDRLSQQLIAGSGGL